MKRVLSNKGILVVNAISIMVAFLTHFPEVISLFSGGVVDVVFPGLHWAEVANEMLFTYISLLLLFFVNEWLFRFGSTVREIGWLKVLCSFVVVWILSNLLGKGFVFLHHHFGIPAIDAMLHHYLHPFRDFLISVVVTGSSFLAYQIRRNNKMALENQQLRTENISNQYEALKSQLNPHMLFNSLNTLSMLIRESPDKAQSYLQELSRVLRYTLQDNELHLISLRAELDFVESYIYLLKMRYEDNLVFHINVPAEMMSRKVPPMAVQMLVENAVKHNEISRRKTLEVDIFVEEDMLVVENALQPKLTGSTGTKVGLDNLSKRYRLLHQKDVVVMEENGKFIVKIPLV